MTAAGHGGLYTLRLLVDIGLLAFLIYAAIRFFRRKRGAPSTITALLVTSLVSTGAVLLVELGAGAEDFAIESGKQLIRSAIGAAVWIPYFRMSKRVTATFVE